MKALKVFLSLLLVVSVCVTSLMPASAGRTTSYLSELQMAEAATEEEAKLLLTEAGFTVLDKNLNPGGSKAVYLGYKKSTNVEDAITDVRVMNMNGGFNISDYETIFADAMAEYKAEVDNIRIAAKEFAENYKAGKKEAQLAYRQLNYYYVELKKGEKTYMGDYMLSFPEKNEDFADILLKGNTHILDNIRILLSMGVADGGALFDRIKTAAADETIATQLQYHEDAKGFANKILTIKTALKQVLSEIEEITADETMTTEEKEKALIFPQYTASLLMGFDHVLESIPCGESNYREYFDTATEIDYKLLYPFVAAMTPGQRAMAVSGQLHSVFVYNAVEMSDEELAADLAETEKEFTPQSVYLGTDMKLMEGAVAVTSDALREEAATGKSWSVGFVGNQAVDIGIAALIGAGGIALSGVSIHYLKKAIDATKLTPAEQITVHAQKKIMESNKVVHQGILKNLDPDSLTYKQEVRFYESQYQKSADMINKINESHKLSVSTVVFSGLDLALGLSMIVFSVYSIVKIVDKYNPKYTKIPSNMVDTVATENGSRFINYKVVDALYTDGADTKTKPGDTNGYDGMQWNAIYYTKSYEAGKCMTATGYFIDIADNFGKYTPVAKFGNKNCYDLNAFNDNDSTESIFIAFGNSNNKKAAETSVPTVVGSTFAYGAIGVSGITGIGIGMALMSAIKRKKQTVKV